MINMKQRTKIITRIILFLIAVIQIFPLYWMLTFSLKGNQEIYGGNILGLPQEWRWENYVTVLTETKVLRYLVNSVIVTGLTIFFTLVLASMVTYSIVRLKWKLSKTVNMIFIMGMMLSMHAVLLPLFINMKPVLNTYWSLVLPYVAFNLPLAILILTGSLEQLPKELEEAAFIDGASIYRIFYTIILPLLAPILSTIAILNFLSAWNEMMLAVTFINGDNAKTITVGVMELVGEFSTDWGLIGAGLVIATVPILAIYVILSENVQKSLTLGAVKG